ncbi:hypothetical protein E0485_14230 [Paenibacillus albiflavus]|uniref:Uncharacterized protein n=1 Tax=Paenibacillus albiflavus TaxID=2545760 RepID=A0A4V2WNP9_9BACL|nr:hypothetical protein [Paenibacillus albiflavus]TCZ76352.1 hypothetical protein E0485_14230 [Paenibacillus albiflavus]
MDKLLIEETIVMLNQKLSPDAAIEIDLGPDCCTEMLQLLEKYEADRERIKILLACYILLQLAKKKHCEFSDDNEILTKQILDGDYLHSIYYDFALSHKETELVAYLAPINKQIHIRMAQGEKPDRMLYNCFHQFISRKHRQVAGL